MRGAMFRRTVGRHALMPPPAIPRKPPHDGLRLGRATPPLRENRERGRRGGLYGRPWGSCDFCQSSAERSCGAGGDKPRPYEKSGSVVVAPRRTAVTPLSQPSADSSPSQGSLSGRPYVRCAIDPGCTGAVEHCGTYPAPSYHTASGAAKKFFLPSLQPAAAVL